MADRSELQTLLETTLGSDAVYFQPPPNIEMIYPCIVYELSSFLVRFADSQKYFLRKRYTITVIDRDPDSSIPEKILALSFSEFNRRFVRDGLHHTVFALYF